MYASAAGDNAEQVSDALARAGRVALVGGGPVPLIAHRDRTRATAPPPPSEQSTSDAEAVLDALPEPLIMVDAGGGITRLNRKAEAQFGYAHHEAARRPVGLLLPGGVATPTVGQHKDGRMFPVAVSSQSIELDTGQYRLLLVRDISDELRRQQRQEEFLVNASHELRAPVTVLRASTEVLLDVLSQDVPEQARRLMANIVHDAARLGRLVDDLLDLNSLRLGRIRLRLAECDLRVVVACAAQTLEPLARRRQQSLEVVLPPAPVLARVDADLLGRAVVNLIDNACKYGRHAGQVEVRLRAGPCTAMLSVSDDGPGIAARDRERVFQRYYRAPTPEGRRIQGNGLGLPLCRAAVDLHGGQVWVESGPAGGSAFHVELPLQGPAQLSRAQDQEPRTEEWAHADRAHR